MDAKFEIVKINDHIWLMNEGRDATAYVVAGTERALVIDTMLGRENIREVAERLCGLPLTVVNTHGHPDHIGGNIYFERAYIHPADMVLAGSWETSEKMAELLPVREGDCFDLGGVQLEVYEMPGHTPGGIVLLDRQDRILFTGDSIIEDHTWMQLPESLPMPEFLNSLQKIRQFRQDFSFILSGHSQNLVGAELYEEHFRAVEEVCQGKTGEDEPYTWFGGVCMAHPYGDPVKKIVYNANHIAR